MTGIARRLSVGGGWAFSTVAVGLGLSVARTLVVARLLDPVDLGLMAVALLALGFVEAVTATGVDTALIAHPGQIDDDLDAAFTVQAVRGLLMAVALALVAPLVAAVFKNPEAAPVVRAISIIALLRGLANPAVAVLIRNMEFRRIFWWSLPEVLTAFALSVGFALARHDVWALVIGTVGGQVVATGMSYVVRPRRPRLEVRTAGIRRLLRFGRSVSQARALMYFSVSADSMVVGTLLGTSALGIYQLALRIAELPIATFARAVGQVVLPGFSAMESTDGELAQAHNSVLGIVLGVHLAFAVAVLLLGGVVIEYLVGARWSPAAPVFRILAFAMVFRAVMMISTQLLVAAQRPQLTVTVNLVRLSVLLVTVVPLLRAWQLEGVAVAVLLGNMASAALALVFVRQLSRGSRSAS